MEYFEIILYHPYRNDVCPRICLTKGLEKDVLEMFENTLKECRPKDPHRNTIPLLIKLTKDEYDLILSGLTDVVVRNGNFEE